MGQKRKTNRRTAVEPLPDPFRINWETYHVAFLDILGFKQLVSNSRTSLGLRHLETIFNIFLSEIERNRVLHGLFPSLKNQLSLKIMSDSVVVYVKAGDPASLPTLLINLAYFQWNLAREGFWLRGGVASGPFYIDKQKDITVGQALTDAYLLELETALVPRIVLHDSAAVTAKKACIDKIGSYKEANLVTTDHDGIKFISYLYPLLHLNSADVIRPNLSRILDALKMELKNKASEHIRAKHFWTARYLAKTLQKHSSRHPSLRSDFEPQFDALAAQT